MFYFGTVVQSDKKIRKKSIIKSIVRKVLIKILFLRLFFLMYFYQIVQLYQNKPLNIKDYKDSKFNEGTKPRTLSYCIDT
jgi:hypothetical protein